MPSQAARQSGHFGSITSATVGSRARCSVVRNSSRAWVHRHPDSRVVCFDDLPCANLAVTVTGLVGTIYNPLTVKRLTPCSLQHFVNMASNLCSCAPSIGPNKGIAQIQDRDLTRIWHDTPTLLHYRTAGTTVSPCEMTSST